MNITINQGTSDVIIDMNDLIELLRCKILCLGRYKMNHTDSNEQIIDTQKIIIDLQEHLLNVCKDYPCDIVNEF